MTKGFTAYIQDNKWHKIRLKFDLAEFDQLLLYPHKCEFISDNDEALIFKSLFSTYHFKVNDISDEQLSFYLENRLFNKMYNGNYQGTISKKDYDLFKLLIKKNS